MNAHLPPCHGIIPARYASTRFPGKPLALLRGKPMLRHVYERASLCRDLASVTLATDDERIFAEAERQGVPVVMTSPEHASGTDRVFEAATQLGLPDDCVVANIQGDEPCLNPEMLCELLAPFSDPETQVTTLARRIDSATAQGADIVKTAVAQSGKALYFSRAPIPYPRDEREADYLGHIGLYAFRMGTLGRFTQLPPSPLELREKLEQLRLLENGIPIRVVLTAHACHGVDRPEDIVVAERMLAE